MQVEVVRVEDLQPEEIRPRTRLPHQADLEVRGGRELTPAGEVRAVLIERSLAVEVQEDLVGPGRYG